VAVDAHGVERGDLLAVALDAELRRQRRAGLADQHERRQHRAEFAHQGQRHQRAEQALGAEAVEHMVALQAKHQAGEEADNEDDRQTAHALLVAGAHKTMEQLARSRHGGKGARHEGGKTTQAVDKGKRVSAEKSEHENFDYRSARMPMQ
jgi:hypothetical protein